MLQPGHVIDVYDDAEGTHLLDGALLEKYGGALDIAVPENLDRLEDRDFALVVMTKTGEKVRKFPMHEPNTLAVSLHYFEKCGESLPGNAQKIAAANLARAHLRFGVEVPASVEKVASGVEVDGPYFNAAETHEDNRVFVKPRVSTKYAYERTLDGGKTIQMFPIADKDETQASLAAFRKHALEMPPRDRWTTAVKLAKLAKGYDLRDEFVEKLAEFTPNPAFTAHIAARREVCRKDEDRTTLDSFEKVAGALPPLQRAGMLEEFDRRAGMAYHWDRRLVNPWDSCFIVKTAATKVGDKTITKEALVKLIDGGKLGSLFKTSMINEFKKSPMEVFESLPTPTKHTIAGMIE
jgi:hypothetical protein